MGLFKYIKSAFVNPWHLLALFGTTGFAVLSGRPDVALPLVLAGEVAYLGLLGTHDKFQRYVDAQEHKERSLEQSSSANEQLRHIMLSLPRQAKLRFEKLKARCANLRQMAHDLNPAHAGTGSLGDLQLTGLDRLLWIYLKLLFTEHTLARFFESTSEGRIRTEIDQLKQRIEREEERPPNEQRERILSTLRDDLSTCEDRLANYQKAGENHELVQLEIRRLENKIQSLGEMAINRREPEFISEQVDEAAGSMFETERTLNDLEFVTGLHSNRDEAVPELVTRAKVKA